MIYAEHWPFINSSVKAWVSSGNTILVIESVVASEILMLPELTALSAITDILLTTPSLSIKALILWIRIYVTHDIVSNIALIP